MKDFNKELKDRIILEEQLLLEFANVSKSDYNTPVGFWVDEIGNKRQNEHSNSPRMKLVNNDNEDFTDLIDISISKTPELYNKNNWKLDGKVLRKMKKFISKNYDIFIARWNNEITTAQMFRELDKNN